jgi:hypothetical protein
MRRNRRHLLKVPQKELMDIDTNCMDKVSNDTCIPNKTGPETCLEADNDKQTALKLDYFSVRS